MKSTATDLRLINVYDLQANLLLHQQRLATIYSSTPKTKHRRRRWQDEIDRLQKNKQHDRMMRSQKNLHRIEMQNSIIHTKLISELARKTPQPGRSMRLDLEQVRRREERKIEEENVRIAKKLVTARADIQPEKYEIQWRNHEEVKDRISKAKRRKHLKDIVMSRRLEFNHYLPDIKRDRSIKSNMRVRSVSSTKPY